MFTKDITARVVGIKTYTGEKDGRKYDLRYANLVYEDEKNKFVKGCSIATYKYNHNKIELEEGNTYSLLLCGSKEQDKYYYEIIGAQRLDK